ncbi:hypothetical protein ACFL2H_09520 [Planctomycetota bacterium]
MRFIVAPVVLNSVYTPSIVVVASERGNYWNAAAESLVGKSYFHTGPPDSRITDLERIQNMARRRK